MWKFGPIQLLVIVLSFYNFGVIYGFLFMFVLSKVVNLILDNLGYEIFRFNDITHVIQEDNLTFSNIVVYMEMDRLDLDTLRNHIFRKEIFRERRLRQGIVNTLGFCLWKDLRRLAGRRRSIDDESSVGS